MKYLVMENHEDYSIVMDETGLFHNVKNVGYDIGEIINEPVFIDSPENKKKFNWKRISTIAAIFVCMLLAGVPFINNSPTDVSVYMTINPAIHIDLTEDGKINGVIADNADGKILLKDYDHRNKTAAGILADLITRAETLEYLGEGGTVQITVRSKGDYNAASIMSNIVKTLNSVFDEKFAIEIRINNERFVALNTLVEKNVETANEPSDIYDDYVYIAYTENSVSEEFSNTEDYTVETYASDDMVEDSSDTDNTDMSEPEDPTEPTDPAEPEDPTEPGDPVEPEDPTEPGDPVEPEEPTEPSDPVEPEDPAEPSDPAEPEDPAEPSDPAEPEDPTEPSDPVEPEDPTEPTEPVDPPEDDDPEWPDWPWWDWPWWDWLKNI